MPRLTQLAAISIALSLSYSITSHAWFCGEGDIDSKRDGLTIKACGTARAQSETAARAQAFDAAQAEATRVCQASADCRGHALNVEPQRTECEPVGKNETRCTRMLVISIQEDVDTCAPCDPDDDMSRFLIVCASPACKWKYKRDTTELDEFVRKSLNEYKHASVDNAPAKK
jgi:hypothetical protein